MTTDQAVELELAWIVRDPELQVRGPLNDAAVETFAEDMRAGAVFPPVVVYCEGARYWLSQGFHRCAAAEKVGRTAIPAEIRSGTREDAILDAAGSNQEGDKVPQLRTNDQKRRAVEMVVKVQADWPKKKRWTQEKIAIHCGVTQQFVSKIKGEINGRTYNSCMSGGESVGSGGESSKSGGDPSPRGSSDASDGPDNCASDGSSPSYSQGLPQHKPLPGQTSFLDDDADDKPDEEPEEKAPKEPDPEKWGESLIKQGKDWQAFFIGLENHGGILHWTRHMSAPRRKQLATFYNTMSRDFANLHRILMESIRDEQE